MVVLRALIISAARRSNYHRQSSKVHRMTAAYRQRVPTSMKICSSNLTFPLSFSETLLPGAGVASGVASVVVTVVVTPEAAAEVTVEVTVGIAFLEGMVCGLRV